MLEAVPGSQSQGCGLLFPLLYHGSGHLGRHLNRQVQEGQGEVGWHLGEAPVEAREGEGVGHQVCRVCQVERPREKALDGVGLHLGGLSGGAPVQWQFVSVPVASVASVSIDPAI